MLEKVDSKPMLKTLRQAEFRWPVLGDVMGREHQWAADQWSLLRTLAEMRNQHGKSVLIRLYVSPDDKNSSHYIIKVRLPPLEDLDRCKSSGRSMFFHSAEIRMDSTVVLAPLRASS